MEVIFYKKGQHPSSNCIFAEEQWPGLNGKVENTPGGGRVPAPATHFLER